MEKVKRKYGDGSGSGSGSGDGSGLKAIIINGKYYTIYNIDDVETLIEHPRGNQAQGYILNKDLTLEKCWIAQVEGHYAHGRTLKEAYADAQNKALRNSPIEQRISMFKEKYPTLKTEVKGQELFDWHNVLTGSCKFGRESFCQNNNISLDKSYTVAFFLEITKNAYGSEVIKQLKTTYDEN